MFLHLFIWDVCSTSPCMNYYSRNDNTLQLDYFLSISCYICILKPDISFSLQDYIHVSSLLHCYRVITDSLFTSWISTSTVSCASWFWRFAIHMYVFTYSLLHYCLTVTYCSLTLNTLIDSGFNSRLCCLTSSARTMTRLRSPGEIVKPLSTEKQTPSTLVETLHIRFRFVMLKHKAAADLKLPLFIFT